MKTVLIISPSFPPINSAEMHRVRQSVPYFRQFGWNPVIVAVAPEVHGGSNDDLLLQTVPGDIEVITIKALDFRKTGKFGLSNLALRSMWYYLRACTRLLKERKIDLVYFSTTVFPLMILGNYWKRRFGVPYIIDMQDPWHSEYYLGRPKNERPSKFWFAYHFHKNIEPIAMRKVDGIVSVSQGYCDMLQGRYPNIVADNCTVIPFGAATIDFSILSQNKLGNSFFKKEKDKINIVYVGRAGHDMQTTLTLVFGALKKGLERDPALFSKIQMYFVGTDYAPKERARKTVEPVAQKVGVEAQVIESPFRIPYFSTLQLLSDADMLFIPGSDDPNYTASKLYPYILAKKPLLAVFNKNSSVVSILRDTGAGEAITFDNQSPADELSTHIYEKWKGILEKLPFTPATNWQVFSPYTAEEMTRKQVDFFDRILARAERVN